VEFEVGDFVRVYDPTAEGDKPLKFRNQWVGPYRVVGKRDMLMHLLQLKKSPTPVKRRL